MLPEFKAKTRVTVNLPAPSGYRQTVPGFHVPDPPPEVGRIGGGRLVLWFCVAVGLHAALLLAIFLTPPLRLKAGYGADRWVHIMPILPAPAAVPAASPPGPAPMIDQHHRPIPAPAHPRRRPGANQSSENDASSGDPAPKY